MPANDRPDRTGFAEAQAPFGLSPVLELSRITLARQVTSDDGVLPPGAQGTVVHTYRDGRAYEVEFTEPFPTVATVEATDIAA